MIGLLQSTFCNTKKKKCSEFPLWQECVDRLAQVSSGLSLETAGVGQPVRLMCCLLCDSEEATYPLGTQCYLCAPLTLNRCGGEVEPGGSPHAALVCLCSQTCCFHSSPYSGGHVGSLRTWELLEKRLTAGTLDFLCSAVPPWSWSSTGICRMHLN